MNCFYHWQIEPNENNQPVEVYCLRCGAKLTQDGFRFYGVHTRFCRIKQFLTSKEHLISIPIDKLEHDGSQKLTIIKGRSNG